MCKNKLLFACALALSGALGTGVANAGNADLQWSIVIGTPLRIGPVPGPVQPVRVPGPGAAVRGWPAPVHPHRAELRATRWDRDGDGIPDRRDRLYNPHWDRDGDGIPTRHDRQPRRAWPAR